MLRNRWSSCLIAATLSMQSTQAAARDAVEEADLALVLAADISYSVDPDELDLQRQGYVSAFRSPEVIDAIRSGLNGRIAVTYLEWGGPATQSQTVPWTIIYSAETAYGFADDLEMAALNRSDETSISAALDQAASLFEMAPHAFRQVIDLSADDYNNAGDPVLLARERVLRQGITINGLPILIGEATDLDAYFRDCVIGGPGAILFTVRSPDDFAKTILRKLVVEIAGVSDVRLVNIAATPSADCTAGEKKARDDFVRQLDHLTNGRPERWLPREEDWPIPE
jgi:hypothetical protein